MSHWPTPRETSWLATGLALLLAVTIPVLVFFIGFPNSDDEEHPPDRTPIVDLCSWFPAPKAAELVPHHDSPRSQTIFYGEVQCAWRSKASDTALELSASRRDGATTTEDELDKAREDYSQKSGEIAEGKSETIALGDEATLTYKTDQDGTEAIVAARDGILVIQVRYTAKANPTTVVTRAKEAATELLGILPPKGH